MTQQPSQRADILILNGLVITMDEQGSRFDGGAVAIAGDRIVAVGHAREMADWTSGKVIDAGGGIIMPGLVNVHTHAAMTCFRGLADDLPLMTWLNDHIFPAEARLDDHAVYMGTLLACAEMIRSGTTCFCDMYLFEDAVARAAHTAGIRAVVGEVLYDFPSPNYGHIEQGFEYTRALINKWRDNPLITIAVEPHSPYLCSKELLRTAAELGQQHTIPLIIHVAETTDEVSRSQNDHGKTPVAYLDSIGILSSNLLACHCVHLVPEDIELLLKHDVKVAHNPESNMKLASGIAPVPELQKAGVCVGLGTDGCASNNDLDMFSEMDTAAKIHKVHTYDPTVMPAESVLKMATIDGARALGLEKEIGSIEPGKRADVIVLDTRKPHCTPMYHPISHMVYSAKGSDVTTSVVNGRVLMEQNRLMTLDLDDIYREVGEIADEIAGNKRPAGR